eukprot:TRINITY_DN2415_c0_g1_i1.p1 TRINITY_DN2415_c0_g1~~TRINITY_DN2415_c0_g1_i1.p1  ORF type:complete len:308 (-),score=41.11 TRINITY_DN2415_c0_g1_i1:72-995(-)
MTTKPKTAGWEESNFESLGDPSVELDSIPTNPTLPGGDRHSRSGKRASVKLKSKPEEKKPKSRSKHSADPMTKSDKKRHTAGFSFRGKSPKHPSTGSTGDNAPHVTPVPDKKTRRHKTDITESHASESSKYMRHSRSSGIERLVAFDDPNNNNRPRPGRSPESDLLVGKREKSLTWSPPSGTGTWDNSEYMHIAPPPSSGKSNRSSGAYTLQQVEKLPVEEDIEIEIEWLGRRQKMMVNFSTVTYTKLKKEITQVFSIDRSFLRLLYMTIILKCWDSKSGKSQEITKHNIKDLSFDHIYVLIVDTPP